VHAHAANVVTVFRAYFFSGRAGNVPLALTFGCSVAVPSPCGCSVAAWSLVSVAPVTGLSAVGVRGARGLRFVVIVPSLPAGEVEKRGERERDADNGKFLRFHGKRRVCRLATAGERCQGQTWHTLLFLRQVSP
jgi:hypothetical protein